MPKGRRDGLCAVQGTSSNRDVIDAVCGVLETAVGLGNPILLQSGFGAFRVRIGKLWGRPLGASGIDIPGPEQIEEKRLENGPFLEAWAGAKWVELVKTRRSGVGIVGVALAGGPVPEELVGLFAEAANACGEVSGVLELQELSATVDGIDSFLFAAAALLATLAGGQSGVWDLEMKLVVRAERPDCPVKLLLGLPAIRVWRHGGVASAAAGDRLRPSKGDGGQW